MSVIDKLASSLNRRDEVPNQELAKEIIKKKDKAAVKELVAALSHKNKAIQSDSIKVLYEVGEKEPALISAYISTFVSLLENKNNRLVWGAMTALNSISRSDPAGIYSNLPAILDAAARGSVITNDRAVYILVNLAANKKYADNALELLLAQLKNCPNNQLPMYAENALPVITEKYKKEFVNVLQSRLKSIEKDSARKRVEKVMKEVVSGK